MNPRSTALLFGLLFFLADREAQGQVTNPIRYTLLNPSYLVDDCLFCGRPTIQERLRGTFDLVLVQDTPPYTRYAIQNINFTSSGGIDLEKHVTGDGTYQQLSEFALTQDMTLSVQVKSTSTNETAFFTNGTPTVDRPFPLIQATLTQTNGNFIHTLTIHLLAAPLREVWFSTVKPLTSTNTPPPMNSISGGDLISSAGKLIKLNSELLAHLGVMPPVPDLGLDAVDVASGGEILFSLPVDVFSETLGPIQDGDLLSGRGAIVKRNQDLLAAFHPASTNDAGLDAVQVLPSGEILFSIRTNVVISGKLSLSRGDILSDQGRIYLTHQELLANFQPTLTNYDFGLTAFRILPSGELWFSVEEGFTDGRLGVIQQGDLLSNLGYKVFGNQELVAAFAPDNPVTDFGLDALWVVTDTLPPKPPPVILKRRFSDRLLHLEWDGLGNAFQVEKSVGPGGPWLPAGDITPDRSWDSTAGTDAANAGFFRVRQW